MIQVNRDYPQNSLVFFPNKWCSFEPFMGSAAYQLAKDVGYFSLPLYLLRLYWRLRDTVPHSAGILSRPMPERQHHRMCSLSSQSPVRARHRRWPFLLLPAPRDQRCRSRDYREHVFDASSGPLPSQSRCHHGRPQNRGDWRCCDDSHITFDPASNVWRRFAGSDHWRVFVYLFTCPVLSLCSTRFNGNSGGCFARCPVLRGRWRRHSTRRTVRGMERVLPPGGSQHWSGRRHSPGSWWRHRLPAREERESRLSQRDVGSCLHQAVLCRQGNVLGWNCSLFFGWLCADSEGWRGEPHQGFQRERLPRKQRRRKQSDWSVYNFTGPEWHCEHPDTPWRLPVLAVVSLSSRRDLSQRHFASDNTDGLPVDCYERQRHCHSASYKACQQYCAYTALPERFYNSACLTKPRDSHVGNLGTMETVREVPEDRNHGQDVPGDCGQKGQVQPPAVSATRRRGKSDDRGRARPHQQRLQRPHLRVVHLTVFRRRLPASRALGRCHLHQHQSPDSGVWPRHDPSHVLARAAGGRWGFRGVLGRRWPASPDPSLCVPVGGQQRQVGVHSCHRLGGSTVSQLFWRSGKVRIGSQFFMKIIPVVNECAHASRRLLRMITFWGRVGDVWT